jgi:HK97 family phage major capsid protein
VTTDLLGEPLKMLRAGDMPAPGSWRSALYRHDAPGAKLDAQPWARSWPEFLAAVFDEHDHTARQYIANAMGERVGSEGGFLIPEQLRSQVMAYITPAIVRPRAMVLPMGASRLAVPTLDNPTQAGGAQALGGLTFSFAEDGASIPSSTPGFGRVVLQAHKLAAYFGAPNDLVNDAAGAFGDFTARVIAAGYHWAEDDFFIGTSGTGAGCPQSLINAACQVAVTRTNGAGAPVLADIINMAKALAPASKAHGYTAGVTDVAWLLSASVFDSLMELYFLAAGTTATSGAPTSPSDWLSLGDGNEVAPSLMGLPAIVTDHQPAAGSAGDMALVDMRHYLIGDRMELTIERSAEGAGFVTDISNYKVTARIDGRYWIQSSSTTEAGQSVSPVVVLH